MKKRSLILSLIFLTALISCKYNPVKEDLHAYAIDMSKRTANVWKAVSNKPLKFEIEKQGVPFEQIEKDIIDQKIDPLWCIETKQVQAIRRAYEDEIKAKNEEIESLKQKIAETNK